MAHRAALDVPAPCVQASVCEATVEHNSTAMETQSESSGSGLAVGINSASEMRMFRKILSSSCIIKSQQRGDPDLTEKQKTDILMDILHRRPGAFLMRFGSLLDEADLSYFDSKEDFEVTFRVKELRKSLSAGSQQKRVRNRRYECLKELTANTSYFSEEDMRDRNPLLYEYYIGKYLTEEEREAMDSNRVEMSLSALIMRNMEIDRRAELLRRQQKSEQVEELDSSSSEDEDEEGCTGGMKLSTDPDVAAQEKRMLRQEFLRAMQLSFLSGEDKEFDYSKVDSNDQYDSLDHRQQDEEEAYFDQEEPSWCEEEEDGIDWCTDGMPETGHGDCLTGSQPQACPNESLEQDR